MADLREGPKPPLIWVKKEIREGRKAGSTSKAKPPPVQGLDPPMKATL